MRCQSSDKNQNKVQTMYKRLSGSPSVCFLYIVLALNLRAKGKKIVPENSTYES